MTHEEAQAIATENGLGQVWFQFNVSHSTGREFEVGYVSNANGRRELFCKRGVNSNPDQFYLCNDFSKFENK